MGNLRLKFGHGGATASSPRGTGGEPSSDDLARPPRRASRRNTAAKRWSKRRSSRPSSSMPCPLPDRIGNIYFVGIYRNTGEAAIDRPRVEATLWDAKEGKLAVGSASARSTTLLPGEEVPIKILVQHAPAYASVTTRWRRATAYGSTARPKLQIEKPKLEPAPFSATA